MSITVYYWAPLISKIATAKAVINSAISLSLYSKVYKCIIINSIGEFSFYKNYLKKYKIKSKTFFKINFYSIFPKYGYFSSRISFIIIFILSFIKLRNLLLKKKPDYLIVHLITSLPLFLNLIYNFNTKFILRISGLPKLNFFRKFFWKIAVKKVYHVTCPTEQTKIFLIKNKIVNANQVSVLKDPIINENNKNRNEKNINYYKKKYKNFIFCAGRLTKQKNFSLIIKSFYYVSLKIKNLNLVIAGDGEERKNLIKLIRSLNLEKRVFLIGYQKNINDFFYSCKIFCLPSLWEDPGFVLIEAAFCNANIVSSDCPNGPRDFFKNLNYKYKFHSQNFRQLKKILLKIIYNNYKISKKDKKILFTRSKEYNLYQHYKQLESLIK
jgi:glycosyltransferase involved in cell wall biosynthesis